MPGQAVLDGRRLVLIVVKSGSFLSVRLCRFLEIRGVT